MQELVIIKKIGEPALVQEFLLRYRTQKTRNNCDSDLKLFFSFIERKFPDIKHPENVQSFHLQEYLNYLTDEAVTTKGTPLSENTISARISKVKTFWSFLKIKGIIARDELVLIKYKKANNKKDYVALTQAQVGALLHTYDLDEIEAEIDYCLQHELSTKAWVKKLVTHITGKIFLYAGLRAEEMATITFDNFQTKRDKHVLKVTGKGNKARVIPTIPDVLLDEIKRYKKIFHKATGLLLTGTDYVFQTLYYHNKGKNSKAPRKQDSTPADTSNVWRSIKTLREHSSLRIEFSCHDLRATWITQLLDQGVNIYHVSSWAGHESIETTKDYDKNRTKLHFAEVPNY